MAAVMCLSRSATGGSDVPVAVSEQDRDNRVAVKFGGFSAPSYICGGFVFILLYDNDPPLPGSPLSPVEVSLHLDDCGNPGHVVSGPVTVSAGGNWMLGGEWVYAELGYVHDEGDSLWLQVRWPSSNPFMPKLGCDISDPDDVSVFGYSVNGEDVWSEFGGHDIMLRLDILRNTREFSLDPAEVQVDSFMVYGRDRLPVSPGDDSFIATTTGTTLHCRVNTDAADNYFCVTAVRDDVESEPSDIVYLSGVPGCEAPVTIVPQHMELEARFGEDLTAFMEISNLGSDWLWYSYSTSYCSSAGEFGIPMAILYASDSLESGQTDSIEFVISSSELDIGNYSEEGTIAFWDALEVYLPESVSIHLAVNDETAVEIPDECRPGEPVLHQNFPNPFNSQTSISVDNADSDQNLSLRIVDILGCTVARLSPACIRGGSVLFQWDGTDLSGAGCPSGFYFYTLSGGSAEWRKMLLVK